MRRVKSEGKEREGEERSGGEGEGRGYISSAMQSTIHKDVTNVSQIKVTHQS